MKLWSFTFAVHYVTEIDVIFIMFENLKNLPDYHVYVCVFDLPDVWRNKSSVIYAWREVIFQRNTIECLRRKKFGITYIFFRSSGM